MNLDRLGGPFDAVLDVGGNVGEFAEAAWQAWPSARITSIEPLPELVELNMIRARDRWQVFELAVSSRADRATMLENTSQPSASTLQSYGPVRREAFGIVDAPRTTVVETVPLDWFHGAATEGRLLVKVDVEGHEREVLAGGREVLRDAWAVVIEMQNDPGIFLGSAHPGLLDGLLRAQGLCFAGLAGAFLAPSGDVLQFDAIYRRDTA